MSLQHIILFIGILISFPNISLSETTPLYDSNHFIGIPMGAPVSAITGAIKEHYLEGSKFSYSEYRTELISNAMRQDKRFSNIILRVYNGNWRLKVDYTILGFYESKLCLMIINHSTQSTAFYSALEKRLQSLYGTGTGKIVFGGEGRSWETPTLELSITLEKEFMEKRYTLTISVMHKELMGESHNVSSEEHLNELGF